MFKNLFSKSDNAKEQWRDMFRRVMPTIEGHVIALPPPQDTIFVVLGVAAGQLIPGLLGPDRIKESPFRTPSTKIDDSLLVTLFEISIDALAAMFVIKFPKFEDEIRKGFESLQFTSTEIFERTPFDLEMDVISISRMLFPRMRDALGESISVDHISSFDIVGAVQMQMLLQVVFDLALEQHFKIQS